jgi:hypothetical protein
MGEQLQAIRVCLLSCHFEGEMVKMLLRSLKGQKNVSVEILLMIVAEVLEAGKVTVVRRLVGGKAGPSVRCQYWEGSDEALKIGYLSSICGMGSIGDFG